MFKSILKFIALFIFFIFSGSQVYAACVVNGTSYKTNDGTGTKVNRTQMLAWASGDVTTCDVTDTSLNNMSRLFARNTTFNQNLNNWDFTNVTNMLDMFGGATAFNNGGNELVWNGTSAVTDMKYMFRSARSLTSVNLPETGAVTDMSNMFVSATSLTSVSLPKTGAVTNMSNMFRTAVSLTSVNLPETGAVTDMRLMFWTTYSLTSVNLPETGAVTNMSNMFFSATSLTSVSLPKTGAVTDMSNMFGAATSLTSVNLPKTGAVTNMRGMFVNATSLTSVSLPKTGAVTNMEYMLSGATSLTSVNLPETGAVTDMGYMFYGATSFAQDIRYWDVNNVEDFSSMFEYATAMIAAYSSTPNWNTTPTAAWFTPDTTAPTLSSVSIASNNSTNTQAITDDVVTLTFTSSETISTPVVTFNSGGAAITDTSVTYVNTSGNTWTAAYTVNASDTSGSVSFSIAFTDTAGNAGTAVTSGSGSVTSVIASLDTIAPTKSSVSIVSNNAITSVANDGDVVTLTLTASEAINTPVVTFKSGGASITDTSVTYVNTSGNTWTADYTANANDTFGAVTFNIAYSDTAGNTAAAVTTTTNSSSVSFMPTPSAAFEPVKADIKSKMAANARTQLNGFATSTASIVGSARSRFMNTSCVTDNLDTALSGDASSDSSDLKGSTKRVTSTRDCKATSIVDVQYQYTETKEGLKSQNASGQIINERKLSGTLTFGRFLGATLGDGDAIGTNNIDINFMGAQAGAYLVGNIIGGLVYDTYFAGSVIENKMNVTTSLMTADTKYYSSMLTTGASVTGRLQVKKVEIRPTLSTDFSYMFRETADFDVKVGSATSVEQVAYGDTSKAQITFAPEFRLPFTFGGSFWDETLGNLWDESSVLTATPNVKCRYLKQGTATEDCGQGLSLGFKANSNDGLLNLTAKAGMDRIGSETTSTLKLQFEQKF
jgi:hypothetical protein|tara:strand:+ start:778 stop:3606 length:2829 start_codon:yes stop_codon:yes gene_type:complete